MYLLPLSEEDIGFYKAPGESAQITARISAHPLRGGSAPPRWELWGGTRNASSRRGVRSVSLTVTRRSILLLVAPHAKKSPASVTREARRRCFRRSDLSDSLAAVSRTRFASTPLSQPLEDKGNKPAWPQDLGGPFLSGRPSSGGPDGIGCPGGAGEATK